MCKSLIDFPADGEEVCYLLHFDQPISLDHTTQHYLGTSIKLEWRMDKHENSPDARLLQVAKERGIGFTLVRIWQGGREKEKALKAQKNSPKLCPICHKAHRALEFHSQQATAHYKGVEVVAYFLGATETQSFWRVYAKSGAQALSSDENYIADANIAARQVARDYARKMSKDHEEKILDSITLNDSAEIGF